MKVFKQSFRYLAVAVLMLVTLNSNAEVRASRDPGGYDQLREVLNRLDRIEYQLRDLSRRVDYLERNDNYPPVPPPNPRPTGVTCLLVDSGYSKTFLGKGRARLEAETVAKQECGRSVNSIYCNTSVKCSDGSYDPRVTGYFCQVIDSGYSKIFSAQGADVIEAEGKAKQACQASVNAIYCGNVTAKCEAIR